MLRERVREERKALIEKLARGAYSAENVQGGYREICGRIISLDWIEDQVNEIFRSSFPELWNQPPSIRPEK